VGIVAAKFAYVVELGPLPYPYPLVVELLTEEVVVLLLCPYGYGFDELELVPVG